MIKKDVIELAKRATKFGYMTHLTILEIYNNTEEIPRDIIRLIIHKSKPRKYYIYCWNIEGAKLFHEMMKDAANNYVMGK